MGSDRIVVYPPRFDDMPGFPQGSEGVLVETLIPKSPVERLYEGVLNWLARCGLLPVSWTPR